MGIVAIVAEVADELAAVEFSTELPVVRTAARQIFSEELTDSPICYVRLSPSTPIETGTDDIRQGRSFDVPVEITVAAKGRSTEIALFDAIVGLAEEIDDVLHNDLYQLAAGATLVDLQIFSLFASQQLRDFGAVQSVLTATYRMMK